MQYKDQSSIDYTKYRDFAERIRGIDSNEIILETMLDWFPKRKYSPRLLNQFAKALKRKAPFKYRLDFDFKADRFIDADTFFTEDDKLELAKLIIKKRYPWQRIKYTLSDVNHSVEKFAEFVSDVKEQHEWIYNPPIIVSENQSQSNNARSEYQQEFVQHYGAYMEIVYLLCAGDPTKQDEIFNWSMDKFLYWGEYLLRKRRIESI